MADAGAWVSLKDAAAALGISVDAARRRVRHQALKGQRRRTPQGWRWVCFVPDDDRARAAIAGTSDVTVTHHLAAAGDVDGGVVVPGGDHAAPGGGDPPPGATYPPPGTTSSSDLVTSRAQEMAVYTQTLLAPYVRRIEEQAEEIGRLKAELASKVDTVDRDQPPARPWWRFW